MDVGLDVLALDLGQDARGGSHHVTMSVRDPAGIKLAEMDADIDLEKFEPNGGWPCGPTCWRAHVESHAPGA
jgi:hypothetical protein